MLLLFVSVSHSNADIDEKRDYLTYDFDPTDDRRLSSTETALYWKCDLLVILYRLLTLYSTDYEKLPQTHLSAESDEEQLIKAHAELHQII